MSMTGFGKKETQYEDKHISIEVRSLNSKNIDIKLGVYSFFLPNTPPKIGSDKKISIREILGLDALAMLKDRGFLFFFFASILICIPLAFYYQHANQFLNEIGMKAAASKVGLTFPAEVIADPSVT